MNTQCPFCLETVEGNETDRLAHVLLEHSARLFMAQSVLSEMRAHNVGWDNYRTWAEEQRAMA